MQTNFNTALELVLKHEGGWSNHPADPGGATMRGVTQRVYNGYRSRRGLPQRSVRSIEQAELRDIYRSQYWNPIHCDDLPSGLDYALFDYCVNSGPLRATKDLQRVLGVTVDGHLGHSTLTAALQGNTQDTINALLDRRMAFLRSLKTYRTFGAGWTRRVNEVRSSSLNLAGAPYPAPVAHEEPDSPAKADESDLKVTQRDGFKEKIVGGLASGGAGTVAALQGIDWRVALAIVLAVTFGVTAYLIFNRSSKEESTS